MTDLEVENYLEAVVQRSRQVLSAEFIGAYAAGLPPAAEVIEQSIAARTGAPPPSRRQARAFQEGVLQAFRRTP